MTNDMVTKQLGAHPFALGALAGDVEVLARFAQPVDFAAGEAIFSAGEKARRFYLIRSGIVALQIETPAHASPRILQSVHEGSVLGWSWLFEPYQWQFDAVCETPVRALAVDGQALMTHCDEDPALGYRLMQRIAETMADRLNAARIRILELG